MPELPLMERTDEDLVEVVRSRSPKDGRQQAAMDVLLKRHERILAKVAERKTRDLGQLLSNVGRGTMEEFVGDVVGQAVRGFKLGKGAQFRTYMNRILVNEMTSGARRRGKYIANIDVDEDDPRKFEPSACTLPPGSLAHVTLLEVRDLAQKCLRSLRDGERRMFVWAIALDYEHEQLQDLLPGKTPANIRKLKQRAAEAFLAEWERCGGHKAEQLLEALGPAMADRLDPDKIKNPKAREAYRAWLTGGLASAAKKAGLDETKTRELLLSAAHDLYELATLRGRGRVLAQVLEIGEGAATADPLLARARRTIALVRAAFGITPLESAFTTLGAFVQGRLKSAEDYETARKALRLTAAEFRRLLADELDPSTEILRRLAAYLEVPLASLKALPHTPLNPPDIVTRGAVRLDPGRIRERAMAWISPGRRQKP